MKGSPPVSPEHVEQTNLSAIMPTDLAPPPASFHDTASPQPERRNIREHRRTEVYRLKFERYHSPEADIKYVLSTVSERRKETRKFVYTTAPFLRNWGSPSFTYTGW
ncbi:hypothetical protein BaRGS_00007175 [Batillaria attramentaria]|uniref:Uncharacterized protein n=1 Tax=Batillaria attramentaria TaxID=370345 RepID=A0ABD0LRV1_9CAEN